MNFYEIIPFGGRIYNTYTFKSNNPLAIGQRVIVNLRNKLTSALVFQETKIIPNVKIKEIEFILDEKPLIKKEHIKFIEKISQELLIPISEVAKMMFPSTSNDLFRIKIIPLNPMVGFEKPIFLNEFFRNFKNRSEGRKKLKNLLDSNLIKLDSHTKKQREDKENIYIELCDIEKIPNISKTADKIINYLRVNGITSVDELYSKDILKKSSSTLETLFKHKIIVQKEMKNKPNEKNKVELTEEQIKAVKKIIRNKDKPHLLYGVTGSGKTEVFFDIAQPLLEKGKKVLILVPEISLTPQMFSRIKNRFSSYKVITYHSNLKPKERINNWYDLVNGDMDVLIGTRSSIWLPIKNLEMIIIDEQHDDSFYQNEQVVYDTMRVAEIRKDIEDLNLVLASATPRLNELILAKNNEYYLEKIEKRYLTKMPDVEIIDMKNEKKVSWLFSTKTMLNIKETLENQNKVIIFTPTRGHSNYVLCTDCGHIFKCEDCDVSLTYHKYDEKLECHYCGKEYPIPQKCNKCGGYNLQTRGYGTERVVNEMVKYFPSTEILRVDRTVIKSFDDLKKTFKRFYDKGPKIIVGTKMITKGLDISDLKLVVIMDSDRYSYFPDYRSYETTASLIMQVAGRAGRKGSGKVLIQTFNPEEKIFAAIKNHDYNMIADQEFSKREKYKYPPFANLILIMLKDKDKNKLDEKTKVIKEEFLKMNIKINGPIDPLIKKIKGEFRKQLIIKQKDISKQDLMSIQKKYDSDMKLFLNPPTTFL
ncbi:MAG: replication restart helicase PriA [Thermotogota bacterium]